MNRSLRSLTLACISLACVSALWAQAPAKHAMTFDDLIAMQRVSEPQISPDGRAVVYTVGTTEMEANRVARNIWVISTMPGSQPRQLTQDGHDTRPQWSPDGKKIAFLSSHDGATQVYVMAAQGGSAKKITSLSTGADNEKWSPDGRSIAFTSSVYPDCADDACNHSRDDAAQKSKVKARVYEHLLYRHWVHWSDGKRSHLFLVAANGGAPRDVTAHADYDVPPDERGDANDFSFSPDSKELCFTAVTDRPEAISTNGDLFVVTADGGEPRRITTNPGFDGHPAYSPDGRFIAYHSQKTPEYESDRWRLLLYDRAGGKHVELTGSFDRSVDEIVWSADSKRIYFTAENEAEKPFYAIAASEGSVPREIVKDTYNEGLSASADGSVFAFLRSNLTMPAEIFTSHSDGSGAEQLSHHNAARLAALDMNPAEPFWFEGAGGTRVEGMLIRPPHFDASKKYPVLLLIHGGPQGLWTDSWSYRWNEELFAAPGYVAVMINPRGSTGYGQKFTDEITDDWGGKVYEDLMKGTDFVLAKYPFVDASRVAAAGGSYGGYMVDWIATHTGRFKALISHAGVYDKPGMYGATEELWFEEHDMQGTPWTNPESYHKWSPSTYAGDLSKYNTPTLVICGELDYRVPYTQSLEFFTALQRQSVPSKLIVYP
ncbi:MAG: peptidase prolyl oligopeptidase active site domain protein, partial [Candidatus Acidoferrum typicum]|nr:peptidase prolyl oligopeptidase active site domain protein [Candidatus Acidoferrum typicum]